MEIKARAEIIFYDDKFEKPEVILTGRWTAREVNRASGILAREYRRYIRSIQKGELTLEETPVTLNEESVEEEPDKEEVSDDIASG